MCKKKMVDLSQILHEDWLFWRLAAFLSTWSVISQKEKASEDA